jgi:hypothetical protein
MLGRRSSGGALVAIVAEVPLEDLVAMARLRSRYGSLTIVHIDRSAWDSGAPVGPPPAAPVLRVTRNAPFAPTWDTYVRASSARGRAAMAQAQP